MFAFKASSPLVITLVLTAFSGTLYLYLFPIFHLCAFPLPHSSTYNALRATLAQHVPFVSENTQSALAPFRLLVLADPQLEGDTSLQPLPEFPSWYVHEANETSPSSSTSYKQSLVDYATECLSILPSRLRKQIDLIGNDYYLAHVYRTTHWWSDPTHVTVLGDLLGSQWIPDDDFERRTKRFWQRVFSGGERMPDYVFEEETIEDVGDGDQSQKSSWNQRIINIAGNHDIGYAGDMNRDKVSRFERVFGKVNWSIRFRYPPQHEKGWKPELRLVILNSMNLDVPAINSELLAETYDFMNDIVQTGRGLNPKKTATVLLTHLPMYKDAGVCTDGPLINYFQEDWGGGISEQNHLTNYSTESIFKSVFAMSTNAKITELGGGKQDGIILTGHDHEGCDVYHHLIDGAPDKGTWAATPWAKAEAEGIPSQKSVQGIREVTMRSMMGDFGGNAGLLSAWYDHDSAQWHFDFATCSLGRPHLWWTVHILDAVSLGAGLALFGQRTFLRKQPRSRGSGKSPSQQ